MQWLILAVAIVAEVIATSALKSSRGFTRLWPSVVVVCCYSTSLYLLSRTLDVLPVGIVYAIWSGSGVALIALVGRFFFKQVLDTAAIVGIAMIVAGVVVLQLFSTSVVH
ncbi:MAG TPA: SMR family transporter [Zoogloea sp.]|uniref:DMT family transporter n=1 Tax=Zoogloea sp. TaxID=49181 RepID=UPI001B3F9158|nr:SMR family transporter [Zoogloea sp.]MBP8266546.1 QacE family quaternary ammonium compound efflux SMR transporter [Zoogloea sp.]HOB47542.1 SMR family transporter [Zoogloea sp.]HQA11420.1 SMR family transporter [Zoogloea sp.]HQE41062.1 SMR family transporter [Zoogloea sp.]